jgi:host factor-I protein
METMPLDPSLPGVRQLQHWIRDDTAVSIELADGRTLEGTLRWQDPEFIALGTQGSPGLVLINRRVLALIRPLP